MKKIISTLAALALAAGYVGAQDLTEITEMYNSGAEAIAAGDKEGALKSFEQAYELAAALGEEGAEIAENCKNVIPELNLSIAKSLVNDTKYTEAIDRIKTTISVAEKFANADILAEAKDLMPKVVMQNASVLLNAKKYAEAAEAYKEVLSGDPANGLAAFRLGLALTGAGKTEEAKAALQTAAENGQQAQAYKQLANLFLKEAAADLKAKQYAKAVDAAVKVTEYDGKNSLAFQIAGQASQILNKDNDAIKYFEKYLELAPTAKNATQIAFTVGALYQKAKNNAKAVEYFQKAVNDPALGDKAKALINALK
ncbi:MAG: tetratricopeptide repeat protein [Bacteroidales bacterium]|nr:tetratricopeptide repeat protein [Bacteroidales bacterium]MCI6679441.1 tetratricopeptide repeat protein [Bacteroides sp.]MDY5891410.1 tetratricopeptide repeat protein [Candidatus Cryptobacteroides sp.]